MPTKEEGKNSQKKSKAEGERSISQKIFIILIKLLEALSDKELNLKIDAIVTNRLKVFKSAEEHAQMVQAELEGSTPSATSQKKPKAKASDVNQDLILASATMTIIKMILFNMDKLFQVSKKVQNEFIAKKVQDNNNNKKEA